MNASSCLAIHYKKFIQTKKDIIHASKRDPKLLFWISFFE